MADSADRFRAYESIRVKRPRTDETGKPVKNGAGEIVYVEADASGDVAFEGDVSSAGIAAFDSGDVLIRRVAFYTGDIADEVCLGSLLVNASGSISVDVADVEE